MLVVGWEWRLFPSIWVYVSHLSFHHGWMQRSSATKVLEFRHFYSDFTFLLLINGTGVFSFFQSPWCASCDKYDDSHHFHPHHFEMCLGNLCISAVFDWVFLGKISLYSALLFKGAWITNCILKYLIFGPKCNKVTMHDHMIYTESRFIFRGWYYFVNLWHQHHTEWNATWFFGRNEWEAITLQSSSSLFYKLIAICFQDPNLSSSY